MATPEALTIPVEADVRHPLVIAVPQLDSYRPQNGIGRVLHSLQAHWGSRVQLVPATFDVRPFPILRNVPTGIRAPGDANLILLPQLTGAQALRDTRGLPSVVIVHDVGIVDFPGDRDSVDWITHQSILRGFRGLRYASHIVAVSDFTRRRLIHWLPDVAMNVTTIPDGVSNAFLEYRETKPAAHHRVESLVGRPLGAPLLLYVGSEAPRKNVGLLLHVFRRVKAYYPSAQLLKVGRPGHSRWRTDSRRSAADLGLRVGDDLLFLEDLDDAMLAHAYRAADLFLSTSLYEGFGLPALEALAIGTPVVVTRSGAFPEVVGDVGWLAEPEPEALLRAALAALANPQSEQRALERRARAATLTWPRSADRYLDVLRKVGEQRRAH